MRINRAHIALILAAVWLWPAISAAAAPGDLAPPPADYRRAMEIQVLDVFKRPLPGVTVEVRPTLGSLADPAGLTSDESGFIRFEIRPVIEDPDRDIRIRDRFLLYKTDIEYSLKKSGFFPESGRVSDVQEFAAYSDPVFQGMNRQPSAKPYGIKAEMAQVSDFLASPKEAGQLPAFVDKLYEAGRSGGFGLLPGSFGLRPDGRLAFGLDFRPLFDPAVYGQVEAGRVLIQDPVRAALGILQSLPELAGRAKKLEIAVRAKFQFKNNPYTEPAELVYLIQAPGSFPTAWTGWTPDKPLPLAGVSVLAGGRGLNLAGSGPESKAHDK